MKEQDYKHIGTESNTKAHTNKVSRSSPKCFKKTVYSCPMAVLNACIQDLTRQKFDIKKIAIFESPPQAILHINNSGSVQPRKSWLNKLRSFKATSTKLTCVKLYVTRTSDSRTPFHLRYEFMPSENS